MITAALLQLINWIGMIVMSVVRVFLDGSLIHYGVEWWWRTEREAQDGKHVPEGVDRRRLHYGKHWREDGWLLSPTHGEQFKNNECILFIHGGGWSVANSHVLLHSMTPFVRQGHTVLAVSYPLSPHGKFPAPIISIIRSMQYAKRVHGVQKIHIHGDSAGGNIATMVAAFATNPTMLSQLRDYTYEGHSVKVHKKTSVSARFEFEERESLPVVASVTSVYGIHDQDSWLSKLKGVCPLESVICSFLYNICMSNYRSPHLFGNLSVCDWVDQIESYPPTLLVCGSRDPLVFSSATFHWALKSRGFKSKFVTMKGARHAYFGFPPCWGEGLLMTQQGTLKEVIGFMDSVTT